MQKAVAPALITEEYATGINPFIKPTENTMETAFEVRPLRPQSFMQRLLKQHPIENAVIELNNLLATTSVQAISLEDIIAIERKYGLSLGQTFGLNLEEFYAVQLNYSLLDRKLSEGEAADLRHLRTLLSLPNQTIEMLHARIGEQVYRLSFAEAIEDGQLSAEERAFLADLQQIIAIPSELAEKISAEMRGDYLTRFANSIGADARITPEEEAELRAISKNLDIKPDSATKRTLERFKLYWALENQPLPVLQVEEPLQKGEICHLHITQVQWYEERVTVRYTKPSDFYLQYEKLEKIDLESGNSPSQQTTFDTLKRIAQGDIYLTNKRVIFIGDSKDTSIKLNALSGITAYKRGVVLHKLTGRSPLMMMKRDAGILAIITKRLTQENPKSILDL